MNELKEIFNIGGWGALILYLLIKYGHIIWKKSNGKYVSWQSLDNRLGKLEDIMPIIQSHLRDSTQRVVDLETLKKDNALNNEFIKENMKEVKDDIKNLFKLVSEVKNMMIQRCN